MKTIPETRHAHYSGVATIDATTHLHAQTNQQKKNVTFCSNIYK